MATSRPTPAQLLCDLPLEAAREATWQGFIEAGVKGPLIDAAQNTVTGTTGDGVLSAARLVRASFQTLAGGTLISLESKPVMGGVMESAGTKTKKAAQVAGAIEAVIGRGWTRIPASQSPFAAEAPVANAPIAAPGAPIAPLAPSGDPVYGGALPPKQGTTLLVYGILGLVCCQIAAPFTVYYATKALQSYGDLDPGDKSLVKVARILGIIGTLLLVGNIVFLAANAGGRPTGY